jgi:hypothetical protein
MITKENQLVIMDLSAMNLFAKEFWGCKTWISCNRKRKEFGVVMADGDFATGVGDGPSSNYGGGAMGRGGEDGPEDGINRLLDFIII